MSFFYPTRLYFSARLFVISIIFCTSVGCQSNRSKAPITDASSARTTPAQRHVVSAGETVYSIALKYDLDYKKLSEINGLDDSFRIRQGQVLTLSRASKSSSDHTNKAAADTRLKKSKSTSARSKNQTKSGDLYVTEDTSFGSIKWQWPVKGKVLEGFNQNAGLNKGIDIGAKLGESVVAAADGEVVYSGSGLRGYGKLLIVKHNQNYLSAYAHNSVLSVSEGDAVRAGQKIAEVGLSGANTSKLHFEIRLDGKPVDPLFLLPKR